MVSETWVFSRRVFSGLAVSNIIARVTLSFAYRTYPDPFSLNIKDIFAELDEVDIILDGLIWLRESLWRPDILTFIWINKLRFRWLIRCSKISDLKLHIYLLLYLFIIAYQNDCNYYYCCSYYYLWCLWMLFSLLLSFSFILIIIIDIVNINIFILIISVIAIVIIVTMILIIIVIIIVITILLSF